MYIRDSGKSWRLLQSSFIFFFLIGRFVLSSAVFSTSQALWQITHMLNLCVFLPLSLCQRGALGLSECRKTKSPQLCMPVPRQRAVCCFTSTMNSDDFWLLVLTDDEWQWSKDAFKDFCMGSYCPAYQLSAETGSPGATLGQDIFEFSLWTKAFGPWMRRENVDRKRLQIHTGHSRSVMCTWSGSVERIRLTWEYLKHCISQQ